MKYVVELGYFNYEFDDSTTAMEFAELALEHGTGDMVKLVIKKDEAWVAMYNAKEVFSVVLEK